MHFPRLLPSQGRDAGRYCEDHRNLDGQAHDDAEKLSPSIRQSMEACSIQMDPLNPSENAMPLECHQATLDQGANEAAGTA
jgi:hypothetical protein